MVCRSGAVFLSRCCSDDFSTVLHPVGNRQGLQKVLKAFHDRLYQAITDSAKIFLTNPAQSLLPPPAPARPCASSNRPCTTDIFPKKVHTIKQGTQKAHSLNNLRMVGYIGYSKASGRCASTEPQDVEGPAEATWEVCPRFGDGAFPGRGQNFCAWSVGVTKSRACSAQASRSFSGVFELEVCGLEAEVSRTLGRIVPHMFRARCCLCRCVRKSGIQAFGQGSVKLVKPCILSAIPVQNIRTYSHGIPCLLCPYVLGLCRRAL